jgi:phosphoribosyl-ATP pyrophosphohydrolase
MSVHSAIYEQYQVALDRRKNGGSEKSYTTYLYTQGLDKILKKCGEETFETVIAAKNTDIGELMGEINDVLYHVTVLLCYQDIPMDDVLAALNRRCGSEGQLTFDQLYDIIAQRSVSEDNESYTRYLFQQGLDKILKKVGEACSLLLLAAKSENAQETAEETADLLYHLMAMLVALDIPFDALEAELDRRSQKTGNLKTFHTTNVNT